MTLSQSALSELLDAIRAGGSADVAEAKSFSCLFDLDRVRGHEDR